VDGTVVAGESAVDESPITGESIPLDKSAGARVFAGTINQSGILEVEAQKVGPETTLARIQRLVEEAQASQAPIQRLADRAARWYVPAALATGAVVWALTGDIIRGITVLIVFCPCALVLATPAAIVASIGKAARRVILVKGGQYAEVVGQIQVVAFDKTGTLTMGRPMVAELVPLDTLEVKELLRVAASAERFSEHPLGVAIRRAAEEQKLDLFEPSGFRSVAGHGVEAMVDGQRVLVGRTGWLEQQLIPLTAEAERRAAELEARGHTVLVAARNHNPVGLIALRDTLRPEAKETVSRLRGQNLKVAMLTGDNDRVAKAIAAEAGIDQVHAGLLPEGKLHRVREWQAQGQKVAFVGDGINDAPALAAADIGIAMGAAGTDVALETSDIAFLSDDLTKMPEVVDLSRRTLRVIRQNIAFSIGLNLVSVLAAGFGWIRPIGGAVIHETGALAVIINAIRLLR
jgi:Cd2+/Zn2+-exporting ATPase